MMVREIFIILTHKGAVIQILLKKKRSPEDKEIITTKLHELKKSNVQ